MLKPDIKIYPQGTPPLDWYEAVQTPMGIKVVISDALETMGNGAVGKALHDWGHYKGNHVDKSRSPQRRKAARAKIEAAEDLVAKETGFPLKRILEKPQRLTKQIREANMTPSSLPVRFVE